MNNPTPEQIALAQEQLDKDIAAHQAEQTAIRRANAEPLPGPLAVAYTIDELAVLGIKLRPVTAGDFILLKKLNSPLYRRTFELAEHQRKIAAGEIASDAKPPQTSFDDEECVEMIYQFSVTLPEARAQLRKGREHFREQAQQAITDKAPIDGLPKLVEAVVANFTAAFSTAVKYGSPAKEDGETVFTTPAAAAATASAGGSTTSRVSPGATPAGSNS